jgi:hypothetical protein
MIEQNVQKKNGTADVNSTDVSGPMADWQKKTQPLFVVGFCM